MQITAYFVFPGKKPGDEFDYRKRVITSEDSLRDALEDLVLINQSFLDKYPNLPDVYNKKAKLRYIREPAGQEFWLTYPVLVVLGGGDCLPLSTLVLRDDYEFVPLCLVKPGDRIMGDGAFTTVTAAAITGEKIILDMTLGNGRTLHISPEHRLFLSNGHEVRAEAVRPGDVLRAGCENYRATQMADQLMRRPVATRRAEVLAVEEMPGELCGDITTEQGRFWLPESDLIVHNCEDLACARVAKLRQAGDMKARAYLYHKGSLWHVMVMRGDGTIEDPSAALGMYDAGEHLT